MKVTPRGVLIAIIPVVILILLLVKVVDSKEFVLDVPTSSMAPTIPAGSSIEVRKRVGALKRGDIVVFIRNKDTFASRVVALPGEMVTLVENGIIVDDGFYLFGDLKNIESVDGSRGYSGTVHGNKSWEVGKDEAFVIGDNYSNSIDSRTYGPIKVDAIIGKVVAVHRRNP